MLRGTRPPKTKQLTDAARRRAVYLNKVLFSLFALRLIGGTAPSTPSAVSGVYVMVRANKGASVTQSVRPFHTSPGLELTLSIRNLGVIVRLA